MSNLLHILQYITLGRVTSVIGFQDGDAYLGEYFLAFFVVFQQYRKIPEITKYGVHSLCGFYNSGSTLYQNSVGEYWSSTANSSSGNSNAAYNLSLSSSSVYLDTNSSKAMGFSVRCVAR